MILQRDLLFANFQGTVLVRDACFSNVTFTNGCPSLDLKYVRRMLLEAFTWVNSNFGNGRT